MNALTPFLPFFGGQKRQIAQAIGVSDQAVNKWEDQIPVRPENRVLQLCELVHWQVTPNQAAPDVYPNPLDGIPVAIRGATGLRQPQQ